MNTFNFVQQSIKIAFSQTRLLSTTPVYLLDQKWRISKKLPMNPNAHGVLTDGPDYTFLDGRLTPLGTRQKQKILKQREIRDKIINLSAEIDFATKRYKNLQIEKEQKIQNILRKKLKPKGPALLETK